MSCVHCQGPELQSGKDAQGKGRGWARGGAAGASKVRQGESHGALRPRPAAPSNVLPPRPSAHLNASQSFRTCPSNQPSRAQDSDEGKRRPRHGDLRQIRSHVGNSQHAPSAPGCQLHGESKDICVVFRNTVWILRVLFIVTEAYRRPTEWEGRAIEAANNKLSTKRQRKSQLYCLHRVPFYVNRCRRRKGPWVAGGR